MRSIVSVLLLIVPGMMAVVPSARAQLREVAVTQAVSVLTFDDQFSQRHDVAALRGDVAVLLFGDRASAEANKQLGERLHVHFHPTARGLPPKQAKQAAVTPLSSLLAGTRSPDVHVVAIACIGQIPALVRPLVRSGFRSASPEVPVWLDFGDQMKKQFGLSSGLTNMVVLDRGGRVRLTKVGTPDAAQFAELIALIEGLRCEGP